MKQNNVLLLFPDQHRGDWLPGANGVKGLDMPNLLSLMEEGFSFTNCVTPSPLCAPARACLALGDDYDHCGTYNNRFCMPTDRKTIYSLIRDRGFLVGSAGKLDLHKPCLYWSESGWLPQLGRIGFTDAVDSEGKWDTLWASYTEANGPYGAYLRTSGLMEKYARDYTTRFFDPMTTAPASLPDEAYADNWVTDTALRILDRFFASGKPWFVTVNFSGPHDPWDITESMAEEADAFDPPMNDGCGMDPGLLKNVRRNYGEMLKNIDRDIGKILDSLRKSGQYDDTLVIYSADHGEMLGDRGQYYKSKPYRASVHIPLILSGPGILHGERTHTPVQLQGVSATIAEWCGAVLPKDRDGRSLLRIAEGVDPSPVRNCQISKLSKSVKTDDSFRGYEEYAAYEKTMSDQTFFSGICRDLDIPWKEIPPVNRERVPDWACLIAEGYKLVLYADGRKELYRTDDIFEQNDLSGSEPELCERLEKRYHLSMFRGEII